MRFHHAFFLAALAIAPVCAEHIKVSDERGIVDSTLSAVGGVDCGGGGLCSSGGGGGGGLGCDQIIRRRMVGAIWAAAPLLGGGNSAARRRGAGFPGPARIIRPDMHDHLLVIFGLMAELRVHLELGSRRARAIALWQTVFDQYFHPINGSGRLIQNAAPIIAAKSALS